MKVIRSKDFTAERAWGNLPIAEMNGIATRLHWTDKPYEWHVNTGDEVFVVLHGAVDMHYEAQGVTRCARLQPGDIFYADEGCRHVAHPVGEARVLVIEDAQSN